MECCHTTQPIDAGIREKLRRMLQPVSRFAIHAASTIQEVRFAKDFDRREWPSNATNRTTFVNLGSRTFAEEAPKIFEVRNAMIEDRGVNVGT
jgi:hypothetical protein